MKIAITGGHFSPAYTVLKKMKGKNDAFVIGRQFAFEGDKNETLEYELCKKENIKFIPLNAGRLQRKFTRYTIKSLTRVPKGILEAIAILKEERPNVVLTFGGYTGLTVSIAAKFLKIPIVLHEQTQKAGLSSKIISKFSDCVCISFESSRKYFKNKNIYLTGNPIRDEIFEYQDLDIGNGRKIIYITGGSTGSHAINMVVFETIEKFLKNFVVIHQTGKNSYNDFDLLKKEKERKKNSENYILKEFFSPQEVGWLLNNSSLVIARAGINTISELIAVGAVGLLIPLPHGQSGEQLENAIYFKKIGLGEYIEEKDLTPQSFFNKASDMIENRKNYKSIDQKVQDFREAAQKIIEKVYFYGERDKSKSTTGNF